MTAFPMSRFAPCPECKQRGIICINIGDIGLQFTCAKCDYKIEFDTVSFPEAVELWNERYKSALKSGVETNDD